MSEELPRPTTGGYWEDMVVHVDDEDDKEAVVVVEVLEELFEPEMVMRNS
jgi:hypothetical protein